jgi:Flp pilus assembly protein TadD
VKEAAAGETAPRPPASSPRETPADARGERSAEPPSSPNHPASAEEAKAAAELKEHAERALAAARQALEAGDWAGAIDRAESTLRMAPKNADAMTVRGLAALRSGDAASAEEWLAKSWEARGTTETPAAVVLAYAEAKLGLAPPRLDEARSLVQSVLKKSPKDPAAVALLARVLEQQGNTRDLTRLVAAAKKGKIESPELQARWQKMFVEAPARRREEAEKFLQAAAAAFDRGDFARTADLARESHRTLASAEAALLAAESFLELGEVEKGLRVLEEVLAEAPGAAPEADDDEAWGDDLPSPEATAMAPADKPRLESARNYFEGRLVLEEAEKTRDPSRLLADAEAWFLKAIESLGGARSEDEKRRQALARLGIARVHAVRGDADKVLEAVKPFENSADPALAVEEARIYYLLGRRSSSLEAKVKAYTLARRNLLALTRLRGIKEPFKREGHYQAGVASLRLADVEGSERHYRAAMESFAAAQQAGLGTPALYEDWALACDRLGNFVKAAQLLRSAYESAPTPASCLRAVDAYLKANPKSPEAAALLKDGAARFANHAEIGRRQRELTGS